MSLFIAYKVARANFKILIIQTRQLSLKDFRSIDWTHCYYSGLYVTFLSISVAQHLSFQNRGSSFLCQTFLFFFTVLTSSWCFTMLGDPIFLIGVEEKNNHSKSLSRVSSAIICGISAFFKEGSWDNNNSTKRHMLKLNLSGHKQTVPYISSVGRAIWSSGSIRSSMLRSYWSKVLRHNLLRILSPSTFLTKLM